MGLFDFWKRTTANERETLPAPNPYTLGFNNYYGNGNGNLLAMLQKRLPNSKRDWVQECGDLSLNSIIAICNRWYLTNFSQVSFQVVRYNNGQKEIIINDVIELLKDPMNGTIAPSTIYGNVITDYLLLGNGYLRKIRGVGGRVVALEYLPADMMRPDGNAKTPILGWIYTNVGQEYFITKEDIIHWRFSRDTSDLRLGRSPIVSLLKEIAADNQASSTAYGLIKNGALPSIIIGPDSNDMAVDISSDDARQIKEKIRQDFTGDQAGGIAVMSGAYKMDRVSFSPAELDLSEIRRLPEFRIPAALGLNAMVLGLGAGFEHSTYNNYQQSQQAAWEDGMIPLLDSLTEILSISLLVEFNPKPGDEITYDISTVKALKEDTLQNAERAALLYEKGIISRAEAKMMISLQPDVEDEGLYYGAVVLAPDEAKSLDIKNISFKYFPNEGMKEAAKRALAWKAEGKDGGTRIGLARANQIVNNDKISEDTILRMYSFFSRHEVDKEAQGFNFGEEGYPSNGRVAWDLWGGDAGYSWSTKIRNRLMEEGKNISLAYVPDEE